MLPFSSTFTLLIIFALVFRALFANARVSLEGLLDASIALFLLIFSFSPLKHPPPFQ